jgi:two-component system response regulator YesN
MKILIADDEDTIRRGVAKYIQLHSDKFDKIYQAENGQEALDILFQYRPELVLLDVQMPLKNGIEVMQEAKKAGLDPVIVILSGYDEFKYAQQAIRYGAKEYLLKPVRATDILKSYEIAYRVGFRDEKYFSRVFKKVKGMSPKEYRTGNSQEPA